MYFTYLGHYTKALMLPAFLGLFIWLIDNRNQVHTLHEIKVNMLIVESLQAFFLSCKI